MYSGPQLVAKMVAAHNYQQAVNQIKLTLMLLLVVCGSYTMTHNASLYVALFNILV